MAGPDQDVQRRREANELGSEKRTLDEVEGHRLLRTTGVLVHRERDPLRLEGQIGRPLALRDIGRGERRETAGEPRVVRPDLARTGEHLVPESVRRVRRHRALARIGGHATAVPVPLSSSMISACFVAASRPWAGPL